MKLTLAILATLMTSVAYAANSWKVSIVDTIGRIFIA